MKDIQTNAYKPVNCTFVDWVEHFATLKKIIPIIYLDHKIEKTIISTITTWTNIDGIEYIDIKDIPTLIRMDRVIQIEGIKLADLNNSCSLSKL